MEPQYRFCRSADGTRIAYAIWGSGPPLLYANTSVLSMYAQLNWAEARTYLDALSGGTSFVIFDRRGSGASQRDVDDLSAKSEAADIAAVADATELREFTLFADIAAAPCARYTIEHSQRVKGLIVWNPSIGARAIPHAMAEEARRDWSYFRRRWAGVLFPDGPVSLQRAANAAYKSTVSQEMGARRMEFTEPLEPLLPRITVPTLLLQRSDVPAPSRDVALRTASLLPRGELRFVPGVHATPYPKHEAIVEAVAGFMGLHEAVARSTGRFTTVLFTDIVDSTPIMRALGDAGWRDLLRTHESMTREALTHHAGTEIKTTGDGVMASFDSASRALECAIDLQRDLAAHNARDPERALTIRIGLNAGEPVADRGDLFGAAVTLAQRIQAEAQGGEILVSDVVRQLVAGRNFAFAEGGEFVPKGFEEPVRVHKVVWE